MPLGQARLYVTAQNCDHFTKYSGMDPEIGYGADKMLGVRYRLSAFIQVREHI